MNRPVNKLQLIQSKIAKYSEKNSSYLGNSVNSEELHQKERKTRSSGSSTISSNVYAVQTSGELQKQHSSFRGHERATDQK